MKDTIIGIGGAGRNILNALIEGGISAERTVYADTHLQAVSISQAASFIQLGQERCGGLPAVYPEIGLEAARQAEEDILALIDGAERLLLITGLGSGTGGGAIAHIASLARARLIPTVAFVTLPARFEGNMRAKTAQKSLAALRSILDEEHIHVLPIEQEGHTLNTVYVNSDLEVVAKVKEVLARQE